MRYLKKYSTNLQLGLKLIVYRYPVLAVPSLKTLENSMTNFLLFADRYQTNQEHGKGYDSKNMMHCIRLIRMAIEIAEQKKVIVKRPDAAELMTIRNGEVDYDILLTEAEEKIKLLDEVYEKSDLPNTVDRNFVNNILIIFRRLFYDIG